MHVQSTSQEFQASDRSPRQVARGWMLSAGRWVVLGMIVASALLLLGAGRPMPAQERHAALVMTTAGSTFSITNWMAGALLDKVETAFAQPAAGLTPAEEVALVRAYLTRSQAIRQVEREISAAFSLSDGATTAETAQLQSQLDDLRGQQQAVQAEVEQVIERQVGEELARRGIGAARWSFPPVQFTFSEPPKKLVVSPRDRIATTYYRMLEPDFSVGDAEATEDAIAADFGLSAYITQIGGMGAYPAMVIDGASLPWVISTVAHEWTHNYLTLFPLGLSYNLSPELTTMNETVAEIVGNEVGEAVVQRDYPEFAPPAEDQPGAGPAAAIVIPPSGPMPFDFRTEMRRTRLEVDRLLAAGAVDRAEQYMEQRRRAFVDAGYPLRKLNQAYFAFHGSYGTSAASSDPIGPKLFALRDQSPDLRTFLRTVRGMMSAAALDDALAAPGSE